MMYYDTNSERYSHLAGLTSDEISIVMFLADVICENIKKARNEKDISRFNCGNGIQSKSDTPDKPAARRMKSPAKK